MKHSTTNSSLFLIELVIVILLFSICAAISMRMFATSKQITMESDALSYGALTAQSAAECYKAAGGDLEKMAEIYGGKIDGDTLYAYFDSSWTMTDNNVVYVVYVQARDKGYADITVLNTSSADTDKYIFALTVKAVM